MSVGLLGGGGWCLGVERAVCGGADGWGVAGMSMEDSKMHMGESFVYEAVWQTDHEGESYMLQHVPTITSISPSRSGMLGGAKLTVRRRIYRR